MSEIKKVPLHRKGSRSAIVVQAYQAGATQHGEIREWIKRHYGITIPGGTISSVLHRIRYGSLPDAALMLLEQVELQVNVSGARPVLSPTLEEGRKLADDLLAWVALMEEAGYTVQIQVTHEDCCAPAIDLVVRV